MIDLTYAFPHTLPLDVRGHATLQDADFDPGCGYISLDEAQILYEVAASYRGAWCEVGSHTGWSASYIAAAGCQVVAIDPQFANIAFRARADENWRRAGVHSLIHAVAATSESLLGRMTDSEFVGAFVDGNHDPGYPLQDAQLLMPRMAARCALVFHDNVGQPVEEAVAWVEGQGFRVQVCETMSRLTICTRDA